LSGISHCGCALPYGWEQLLDQRMYNISIVKPTRCTISQICFILDQHSTCFGRSYRPSSGI